MQWSQSRSRRCTRWPPPKTATVGFAVHVFHGVALGAAFADIVGVLDFESPGKAIGLGLAWGVVTWVALAAVLMPIWLDVVGSPASPPPPNFVLPSLLWHAVYGLVLGGVYVAANDAV